MLLPGNVIALPPLRSHVVCDQTHDMAGITKVVKNETKERQSDEERKKKSSVRILCNCSIASLIKQFVFGKPTTSGVNRH